MAIQAKGQDASDAVLSAIEEALNLTPDLSHEPATIEVKPPEAPRLPKVEDQDALARTRAQTFEAILEAQQRRKASESEASAAVAPQAPAALLTPSTKPANDDRRSVGQILQALQYRPSNTPTVAAFFASAIWLGLVGFHAYAQGRAALTEAQVAFYALAGFGPAAFFFISAALTRRVQEMRHTARSMSEVAIRLADPESFSTDQVMMLSQAIRREVASMGDGVERALARAGELEMLVHNEVSNLERSYADNERRMRTLIDELSSEREAIVGNADRVRQVVTQAQETVSRELAQAGTRISDQVSEAGARVSASLGNQAEELSRHFRVAGEGLVLTIGEHGTGFINQIASAGEGLVARIAETSDRIHNTVAVHGASLNESLAATGEQVASIRKLLMGMRYGKNLADDVRGQIFALLNKGQRRVLGAAWFILSVRA